MMASTEQNGHEHNTPSATRAEIRPRTTSIRRIGVGAKQNGREGAVGSSSERIEKVFEPIGTRNESLVNRFHGKSVVSAPGPVPPILLSARPRARAAVLPVAHCAGAKLWAHAKPLVRCTFRPFCSVPDSGSVSPTEKVASSFT